MSTHQTGTEKLSSSFLISYAHGNYVGTKPGRKRDLHLAPLVVLDWFICLARFVAHLLAN